MYGEPKRVLRLAGVGLVANHFYWDGHGRVFDAVISLARQDVSPDEISTNAEMERLGTRTDMTRRLVNEAAGWVPQSRNASYYAERIVELARWRERLRLTREMLETVERRDTEAWEKTVAVFSSDPIAPEAAPANRGKSVLRLVDEQGEVVGQEVRCDSCGELQDQLDGAQREIAGWRTRYANLERDKDRTAAQDALYLPAQALFEHWKTTTGHKNCKWTPSRFRACEPMLKAYGVEVFARAIAGIANDPYTKVRKNGTIQKYDSWETLTKNMGSLEEYANRAPQGWEFTLNISIRDDATPRPKLSLGVVA